MTISEKDRKILWARSGNRCAFCKCEVLVHGDAVNDSAVVGDECHIFSNKKTGPRYKSCDLSDSHDISSNLILLCRTHHKMVDDQSKKYSAEVLVQLKRSHENWVKQKLDNGTESKPIRIKRIPNNIPKQLIRLSNGNEIINLTNNAFVLYTNHDDLKSEDEANINQLRH